MGLKKDVMCILPKLVEYEKSHGWLKEVVWFNDVSEFMGAFEWWCEEKYWKIYKIDY